MQDSTVSFKQAQIRSGETSVDLKAHLNSMQSE